MPIVGLMHTNIIAYASMLIKTKTGRLNERVYINNLWFIPYAKYNILIILRFAR